MTDKLQETVNRENALHGETLIEDGAGTTGSDTAARAASSSQAKRDELNNRIAAGQDRNRRRDIASQARDAAGKATEFAKEHPVATVVGGLAIGLLLGSMTRKGRSVGRRAGGFASSATDAALAFGLGLLDDAGQAARHGKDALGDMGEKIAFKGRQAKRDADYYTRSATDGASVTSRLLGRTLSRRLRDL